MKSVKISKRELRTKVVQYALAFTPLLSYLFLFKYYGSIREASGMDSVTKPSRNLPNIEKAIFGCLPHRVLGYYTHPFLDMLAAAPYLFHFILPVAFILYLAWHPRRYTEVYAFIWCAGMVNFLAVIIQFLFPCAPPWFNDSAIYSADGELIGMGPNEAGFARLDRLLGITTFADIYGASTVKFGAMPSLHVAWPCVIYVSRPWIHRRVGMLHCIWITWAALYSSHHYGVDALAGICLTLVVHLCMVKVYCPFPVVSQFFPDAEPTTRPTTTRKARPQQESLLS